MNKIINILKDKAVIIAVSIAVLLFLWIQYTNLVVIPREELAQAQAQEQADRIQDIADARAARLKEARDKAAKEREYNTCLSYAFEDYDGNWETNCKAKNRESDCSLPLSLANSLDATYEKAQDRCLSIYKSK